MNITNTLLFFVDKMWEAFAMQMCIYLTSWGLNDDVKLTKFWTIGPWLIAKK